MIYLSIVLIIALIVFLWIWKDLLRDIGNLQRQINELKEKL